MIDLPEHRRGLIALSIAEWQSVNLLGGGATKQFDRGGQRSEHGQAWRTDQKLFNIVRCITLKHIGQRLAIRQLQQRAVR